MAVVVKTFTTPGGKYVYDRETNSILSVGDVEFEAFCRIEAGDAGEADLAVLERYQGQGYCLESELEEILHPATPLLEYQLNSKVRQITMQVTQNCNLRCKYCAYGGGYENQRTHSNKTMPLETMKKCVDFLMERSRDMSEVYVAFYGGEPLLEIEKIKSCIDYINDNYEGRTVKYVLTTNGTLFDEATVNVLEENEITVMISFDGPKELHNINRVYHDGKGSFDDIMEGLEHIKANHPVFFQKISFLSVVAPGIDYACVNDFFNASDVMDSRSVMVNPINQYNVKDIVNYDDLYILTYNYQRMKALFATMGMYDHSKVSKVFTSSLNNIKTLSEDMSKRWRLYKSAHPSGPCIPGVMRPFVAADGYIYPCERVGEGSDAMKIGHIDSGIDLEKANALLNVGKLTEKECITCWNFRNCMLCCAASDGGDELSAIKRLQQCRNSEHDTLDAFTTICLLLENGVDISVI